MTARFGSWMGVVALVGCADPEGTLPLDQAPTPTLFNLEVSALLAGEVATFTASGLSGAGVAVTFVSSTSEGAGPCAAGGAACLDVAGPVFRLGTVMTDATGTAVLTAIVPAAVAEGTERFFQAAARDAGVWMTSDVEARESGDAGVCGDAEERSHDPSYVEWSYHGVTDGPDDWGGLTGYGTCGAGVEQTPVDIVTGAVVPSTLELEFHNYDLEVPLDLLNNGHTLQVTYTGQDAPTDPHITYDGQTWFFKQFHVHTTSEHTIDGVSYPFEIHFVHRATDGALAVVGVWAEHGAPNEALAAMLENDPGHHMASVCTDGVALEPLLPLSTAFYHYEGSLTTPPCTEGVAWFVMDEPIEASDEQEIEWQTEFGGTTNRPVMPLGSRSIFAFGP